MLFCKRPWLHTCNLFQSPLGFEGFQLSCVFTQWLKSPASDVFSFVLCVKKIFLFIGSVNRNMNCTILCFSAPSWYLNALHKVPHWPTPAHTRVLLPWEKLPGPLGAIYGSVSWPTVNTWTVGAGIRTTDHLVIGWPANWATAQLFLSLSVVCISESDTRLLPIICLNITLLLLLDNLH